MAHCPNCGVSTRTFPGIIEVRWQFDAKPLGEWSLAGRGFKVPAVKRMLLECLKCGFSVTGRIEGETFVADRVPDPDEERP